MFIAECSTWLPNQLRKETFQTKVSVADELSLRKCYYTEHACIFGKFKGKFRKEMVSELRSKLSGQQSFLRVYHVIRNH